MEVMIARDFRPSSRATRVRSLASSRASSWVSMIAPRPHFTSKRIPEAPAASFFPRMLATIRGRLSTVPVTSRSA